MPERSGWTRTEGPAWRWWPEAGVGYDCRVEKTRENCSAQTLCLGSHFNPHHERQLRRGTRSSRTTLSGRRHAPPAAHCMPHAERLSLHLPQALGSARRTAPRRRSDRPTPLRGSEQGASRHTRSPPGRPRALIYRAPARRTRALIHTSRKRSSRLAPHFAPIPTPARLIRSAHSCVRQQELALCPRMSCRSG
jgi:hypothetical protein